LLKAQYGRTILSLVFRSRCISLSHITDGAKGKFDIVTIGTLSIIIMPSSYRKFKRSKIINKPRIKLI
jgi:hypothetical protein